MKLAGKTVLIVATDGFEEWELFGPLEILSSLGAEVRLASPRLQPIRATVRDDPGKSIRPDMLVEEARTADFDALILPGGLRNPDQLRTNSRVIALIRSFAASGKPVAAVCHGPWLLIEADLLRGRTATAWPSIWTDLRNAGAHVVDQAVAVDGNIITSRNPDDVEAFATAIAQQIAEGCEAAGRRAASIP